MALELVRQASDKGADIPLRDRAGMNQDDPEVSALRSSPRLGDED